MKNCFSPLFKCSALLFLLLAKSLTADAIKPVITLEGNDIVHALAGSVHEDEGVNADDNEDGDLTDKVVTTFRNPDGVDMPTLDTSVIGRWELIYTVSDEAGNTATATRFVEVSAKLPPALWEKTRSFGGVDSDYVAEIQQDHDNNLYLLGSFAGSTVTFDNPEGQAVQLSKSLAGVGDPTQPAQGTPRNIFILKVSGDGEPLWGKILGVGFAPEFVAGVAPETYNGGAEYGFGISVNNNGIAVFGRHDELASLGETNMPEGAGSYVAQLDAEGEVDWVRPYKARGDAGSAFEVLDIATGANGIAMTGYLNGNVDLLDPDHPISSAVSDTATGTVSFVPSAFTVKLDENGEPKWKKVHLPANAAGGLPGSAYGVSVAIDQEENVLTMGSYSGSLSLGDFHLEGGQGFLVKFGHEDGSALWAKEIQQIQSDATTTLLHNPVASIQTDEEGNVYLAGRTSDNAAGTFAGVIVDNTTATPVANPEDPAANSSGLWVARLSPHGSVLWARILRDDHSDGPVPMALANNEGIYLAVGESTPPFGTINKVLKLSADGRVIWEHTCSGSTVRITSLSNDTGGDSVNVAGTVNKEVVAGIGGPVEVGDTLLEVNGAEDIFMVELQRNHEVDIEPPSIEFENDGIIRIIIGSTFEDEGVNADDNEDGELTDKVVTTFRNLDGVDMPTLDTSVIGRWELIYTVSDEAGNTTTATRFVEVSDKLPPALWEKTHSFGGVDSDYVAEVQQDHDNNLYLLGSFAGSTVTFDNPEGQAVQLSKSLVGVGDPTQPGQGIPRNIFILKVSDEGKPLWGKILGVGFAPEVVAGVAPQTYNGGAEYGFGISVNNNGIAVFGRHDELASLGETNMPEGAGSYVAQLDAEGEVDWVRPYKARGDAGSAFEVLDIAAGTNGVAMTGYLNGSVDLLDPDHPISSAVSDTATGTESFVPSAFTVKLDENGEPEWKKVHLPANAAGGLPGSAYGVSVAIDQEENVLTMGSYSGSLSLGDFHLEGGQGFLVKFGHEDGSALWAKEIQQIQSDATTTLLHNPVASIQTDEEGNVYLAGRTSDNAAGTFAGVIVDNTTATPVANPDDPAANNSGLWVARLSPHGSVLWARILRDDHADGPLPMTRADNGGIYLAVGESTPPFGITNKVLKVSSEGLILWQQACSANNSRITSLSSDPGGDTVNVAGTLSNEVVAGIGGPVEIGDTLLEVNGYEDIFTVELQRNHEVDIEPPSIDFEDDEIIRIITGSTYKDKGVIADDNEDGDLTDKVVTTFRNPDGVEMPTLDTSMTGRWELTYTVSDKAGNTATDTRSVVVTASASPALWEKTRSFGGVDSDYVAEIQQDHDNNLYLLGSFAGSTVTFDNPEGQAVQLSRSLVGVGDPTQPAQGTPRNIFILKVSGDGEPLWGKILGVGFAPEFVAGVAPETYNGGAEYGFGISVNNNGIAVFGRHDELASLGETNMPEGAGSYVAQLDAEGEVDWVRPYKARGDAGSAFEVLDIAAGTNGVAMTGYLNGSVDLLDPDHPISSAVSDTATGTESFVPSAFTVKLDENGEPEWKKVHLPANAAGGLPGSAYGVSVAIDQEENVLTMGSYSGSLSFDDFHLEDGQGFLVKFGHEDGSALWAKEIKQLQPGATTTLLQNPVASIQADEEGNVYLAGRTSDNAAGTFAGVIVDNTTAIPVTNPEDPAANSSGLWAARLSPHGSVLWARVLRDDHSNGPVPMALANDEGIYLAVGESTPPFGSINKVLKLSSEGLTLWGQACSGSTTRITSLSSDPGGESVKVAGTVSNEVVAGIGGPVEVGDTLLEVNGYEDIFMVELGENHDTGDNDPTIEIKGEETIHLTTGSAFEDPGAEAHDEEDGDLTAQIIVIGADFNIHVPGTYTITYVVSDSAGNEEEATRTVVVEDETEPRIPQVITVQPITGFVEDSPIRLVASSNSGLTVAFDDLEVETGEAELEGNLLILSEPSSGHVYAIQPGNAVHEPAERVKMSFNIVHRPGGGNDPFTSRILPGGYIPGQALAVTLIANPPGISDTYAVEDKVPTNWVVSQISHEGVFDAINGKVKFGPFFDSKLRELTYFVTPPADADGEHMFNGNASVDGKSSGVEGSDSIAQVQGHPADNAPANFRISMDEVTRYGSSWKKGESWTIAPITIPIAYVTNAAAIWKKGEVYELDPAVDTAPLWWVNTGPEVLPAGDPDQAVNRLAHRTLEPLLSLPNGYSVSIVVEPGQGDFAYAVEEAIPDGWEARNINNDGFYDAASSIVRWGPFIDNTPRAFSFEIQNDGEPDGEFKLQGIASFDGENQEVAGDTVIIVSPPGETAVDDWLVEKFGSNSSTLLAADSDGDGVPNLVEYAFGFDPGTPQSKKLADITSVHNDPKIVLEYTVHRLRTDVTVRIQTCNALGQPWTDLDINGPNAKTEVILVEGNFETRRVTITKVNLQQFLRLVVER